MTNPFGDMFGDIFSLLANQGPDAWYQTASQLALSVARGEDGDPNPNPLDRERIESLAPLVARHVETLLSVATTPAVSVVNRTGLTQSALEQWKPLLAPAIAASSSLNTLDQAPGVDLGAMASTLGPLFLGFQLGSVAGHFSQRAWARAVLPLPRVTSERTICSTNVATFANEWSLDTDAAFVFALALEIVADVVLTQPGLGDALRALLLDSTKESMSFQGDVMHKLRGMMGQDATALMGDPSALVDELGTLGETAATNAINAAVAVLLCFFEAAALSVVTAMFGPQPAVAEAWRRYRLSDAQGEDGAAALFGISNHGPHHELAKKFVDSLEAAHSLRVFDAFLRVDGLPTWAELASPDAWYERITTSPLA